MDIKNEIKLSQSDINIDENGEIIINNSEVTKYLQSLGKNEELLLKIQSEFMTNCGDCTCH